MKDAFLQQSIAERLLLRTRFSGDTYGGTLSSHNQIFPGCWEALESTYMRVNVVFVVRACPSLKDS